MKEKVTISKQKQETLHEQIDNLIHSCEKLHAENPEKCIKCGKEVLELVKSDDSIFKDKIATASAYIGEGYLRLNKFASICLNGH